MNAHNSVVEPPAAPTDHARLPLEPLLKALPIDRVLARRDVVGPGEIAQAARMLGVSTTTLHRLRRTGLSIWVADRLAISAGLHPLLVWHDDWADALTTNLGAARTSA
jgi:hypothetical protein